MAKEAQAVRVKGGGRAVFFKAGTDDAEVTPGGVCIETAGHDAPGMIVGGEDEGLLLGAGPPLVRRGIMLVEFSNGRALPAPSRLGAARIWRNEIGIMLLNVSGDAGTRAFELEAPVQLLGDKGVVERFGNRQNLLQKAGDRLGPPLPVIAAGSFELKGLLLFEPLRAQAIKMGAPDLQPFARRGVIHGPGVKGLQNLTD